MSHGGENHSLVCWCNVWFSPISNYRPLYWISYRVFLSPFSLMIWLFSWDFVQYQTEEKFLNMIGNHNCHIMSCTLVWKAIRKADNFCLGIEWKQQKCPFKILVHFCFLSIRALFPSRHRCLSHTSQNGVLTRDVLCIFAFKELKFIMNLWHVRKIVFNGLSYQLQLLLII